MAKFTVNYNANTTGEHRVYYRTYSDDPAPLPAPAIATHQYVVDNVDVPGPRSVEIEVEGNLYCGDITYTGYVIALFQLGDPDVNADGIPDSAQQFTVPLLQQTDPCILTDFLCENTGVLSTNVTLGGTGYSVGEVVTVTETSPGDEIVPAVIEVGAETGGVIDSLTIITPGLYKAAPTLDLSTIGGFDATAVVDGMEDCPALDLTTYQCLLDDGNAASYILALADTVSFCSDVAAVAGLTGGGASQFLATEAADDAPCYCRGCVSYDLTNNGAAPNNYTVKTCWDGSEAADLRTTSASVAGVGGTTNTVCAIKGSLVLENPSEWVVVENPCP